MTKCRRLALLAVVACTTCFTLPASAGQLGLDFNGYSFDVFGSMPLDTLAQTNVPSANVGAGFIYDSSTSGDHLKFFHADLLVNGDFGLPGATAGVGVRGVFADREDYNGAGLAVGGKLGYFLPQYNRLGITGDIWYAPNVLMGGDFQHYLQYGVDLNYRVLRQATIFIGYRRLLLPLEGAKSQLRPHSPDQGWHLGLRVDF